MVMDTKEAVKWPVTNEYWYYKRYSLRKYLLSLNVVEPYDMSLSVYDGIDEFYIRCVYGLNYEIFGNLDEIFLYKTHDYTQRHDELKRKMEHDPWNRPFKCFPYGASRFAKLHVDDRYDFSGHYILEENTNNLDATVIKPFYDCYVITTTVEGNTVYCLDLMAKQA